MRSPFFIILILIAVIGCSAKKSSVSLPTPDQLDLEDKKTALDILSSDQVYCRGDCSESVAAFYLYYGAVSESKVDGKKTVSHQIKLCSATLISKNKILTNKHCIEDILQPGDFCTDKVFIDIKFPETKDKPFSTYKCKKVVSASEDYFYNDPITNKKLKKRLVPDWAVIELTENVKDRKPISVIADASDLDYLPVTLFPVYFDTSVSPPRGVVQEVRCDRVFNSGGLNIFANDSDSPLFRIENCSQELTYGNSGSGVFYNNSSQLLGVMATAQAVAANGTVAHCLPDFDYPGNPCIFPHDAEFTSVMKSISFLAHLQKHTVEPLVTSSAAEAQWALISGFLWADKSDDKRYRVVRSQFGDHWMSSVNYLKEKGSEALGKRYLSALQRLLLPRVPKCFSANVSDKVDLLMIDIDSWKKMNDYQWREKIEINTQGKELSVLEELHVPRLQMQLRPVSFLVSDDGSIKVLKAVGADLPEPLVSLELRLPKCP